MKISSVLQELQNKIAALEARVKALEGTAPVLAAPAPLPAPVSDEISEEVMLVIAAAVAAYLGERAHVRVVRLVPSHAWAQQGRVSIQASHRLQ